MAPDVSLFTLGIGLACAVTALALWKGRSSALGWFVYAGLLWPVALIHALIMEPRAGSAADHPRTDR